MLILDGIIVTNQNSEALGKSYAATTVIEIDVTNQAGAAGNTVYLFGFLY